MDDPARLYETDWHAWTADQAAKLRSWPPHLRPNALDFEHIAEEIEDLGRSVETKVQGLLVRLVEHLLKLEFHPDERSRPGWRKEVRAFRVGVEGEFDRGRAPGLRARLGEDIYPTAWRRGLRVFLGGLEDDGIATRALVAAHRLGPGDPPRYDLRAQVLDEAWFPQPVATGDDGGRQPA